MSLTLSGAVTEVRRNVNESIAGFWSDTEIEDWIKEGTRTFSSKSLMVEGTDTVDPMIASTLYYDSGDETWIADLLEIYTVIYFNGTNKYKGLIKIHPRQIGNLATATAGPPKYYCLHDRKLYVLPLTSATEVAAGATLSVLYAKETDDITALTDEFQHLAVIYATAKAYQKDEKWAAAGVLMGQFFQEVAFERNDKHARETDSLDKFRIPAQGGGTESANG
jgi:hypothetical protein